MSKLPFRLHRGLLYVSLTLTFQEQNIHLENCIFDTGAAGSTFDTDELIKIGIKATPDSKLKRLITVGGYQTVFTSFIDQIILGSHSLCHREIEVGNLHSTFGIQGILGTDIIRHFNWHLNFEEHKLTLEPLRK